jgi:zeaxanthin glucosyltransferase
MARIILAMLQETGHLNGTLALARALHARGHEVRYLAVPEHEPQIQEQGFETIPIMAGFFPRGAETGRREDGKPRALAHFIEDQRRFAHLRQAFDAFFGQEIDTIIAEQRPDLFLVDPLIAAIAVVTHRSGVRTAMLSTTLPLVKMPGVPPLCSSLPPAEGLAGRLRLELAWSRLLLRQFFLHGGARLGLRFDRETYLMREVRRRGFPRKRIQRASFYASHLDLPELVLCPREFDFPQVEENPDRHYVGAGVDLERREPDFPWDRLSSSKPLVYCSLGSAPQNWPHFPRFLSSVLDAMRIHPEFQWVLSTGKGAHAEALERAPAEAVVVPYAPQLKLLARAAVMVGHGGLNSLKEAMWHGVPVVALPCMVDQWGNAARLAYHGLGLVEDVAHLTGEKIARCISRVLGEPSYRQRMEAMRQAFHERERSGRALQLVEAMLSSPS